MIEPVTRSLAPGSSAATLGADPGRAVSSARRSDAPAGDFAAMLGELATGAASALKNAESLSIAGIRGRATVQQVVEAVMSAEQTLQGAIAIRDKVVSAYLELSRMSI
jgi:flagellar hook-basal body complex protein FliE